MAAMSEYTATGPLTLTADRSPADDDLVHIACDYCDLTVTLCGADTSAEEFVDDDVTCVVCLDLEDVYDASGICCPKGARRG